MVPVKGNVIIASENPVKINAVIQGFNKMISGHELTFSGCKTRSDVSDQPMTNEETRQGAFNRAKNAKALIADAEFWVGIEGGIEPTSDGMQAFAWIVILSNETSGMARTSTFYLPHKIATLIEQGMELGEADDRVFNKSNSKQQNGAVGILTKNNITRTSYYTEAVILALIPFIQSELY